MRLETRLEIGLADDRAKYLNRPRPIGHVLGKSTFSRATDGVCIYYLTQRQKIFSAVFPAACAAGNTAEIRLGLNN